MKFNLLPVPHFGYTVLYWFCDLETRARGGRGGELLHAFLKQKSIAVAYFGLTYLYNWCIPDLFVSGESYISAGLCKR